MSSAVGSIDKNSEYSESIMASSSTDTDSDAAALLHKPRIGDIHRSRSRRGGYGGYNGGSLDHEHAEPSEFPLFSPQAKTREEELERAQLLEGKKHLKKMGLRQAAMTLNELTTGTAGTATTNSSSGHRLGETSRSTRSDASSVTHTLLELLVSEMARMRSTLESLAQDGAVLAEIQKTNKLLALMLTSGRRLEGYEHPSNHPVLVERIKEKAKPGEIILKTI